MIIYYKSIIDWFLPTSDRAIPASTPPPPIKKKKKIITQITLKVVSSYNNNNNKQTKNLCHPGIYTRGRGGGALGQLALKLKFESCFGSLALIMILF